MLFEYDRTIVKISINFKTPFLISTLKHQLRFLPVDHPLQLGLPPPHNLLLGQLVEEVVPRHRVPVHPPFSPLPPPLHDILLRRRSRLHLPRRRLLRQPRAQLAFLKNYKQLENLLNSLVDMNI